MRYIIDNLNGIVISGTYYKYEEEIDLEPEQVIQFISSGAELKSYGFTIVKDEVSSENDNPNIDPITGESLI